LAGERADRAAAALLPAHSRTNLSRWIRGGELTVDGRTVKPNHRLGGGERLSLDARLTLGDNWSEAQHVPFRVLYEDEHVLVVDKPAGVVVHPGAGNRDHTLVNGLLERRPELRSLPRAGVVHRLDKDTSGVMVIAASPLAHRRLVAAIQAREVARDYLAVAEGRMVAGLDIDRPIGRHPTIRTRQAVRADGRPALTRVRVRARFRSHTLLDASLATGRTHQIRVHLAAIGHPLAGDRRYGARGRLPAGAADELVAAVQAFARQALHARRLAFRHPATQEEQVFEAPVPADLAQLIDLLERDAERDGR
jgi:23S rRNA pseudouridine1911/1915/1917 synthase